MKEYKINQEDLQIVIKYKNEKDLIDKMDEIIDDLISYGAIFYNGTDDILCTLRENSYYDEDVSFYNDTYTITDEKIEQLENIKNEIFVENAERNLNDNSLVLYTHNLTTGDKGIAIFMDDDENIRVFEGNAEGEDDKILDYEAFVENYSFHLGNELEENHDINIGI